MLGLSIEHKVVWYLPENRVHPIGDYSKTKQDDILKHFGIESIGELKPGSYVETDDVRVIIVDIED